MFSGTLPFISNTFARPQFPRFTLPLARSTPCCSNSPFGLYATPSLRLVGLALALLGMSACTSHFDRFNLGTAELWIGGRVQVHQECARRGVVTFSNDTKILGCTDFKERLLISVRDPKVIAHEWCHWVTQSDSHEVCPTPDVRLH